MNVSTSYIVIVAGPTPTRNIGPKMAAKIETSFGLEPGALDKDPPADAISARDPYLSEIVATLTHATDTDKEFVLSVSQWVASRSLSPTAPRAGKISLTNIASGISDVRNITEEAGKITHNESAPGHKSSAKLKGK